MLVSGCCIGKPGTARIVALCMSGGIDFIYIFLLLKPRVRNFQSGRDPRVKIQFNNLIHLYSFHLLAVLKLAPK